MVNSLVIRHFCHHLRNCPFTVVTDHKPLVGLRKLNFDIEPMGHRGQWAMERDPYDWVIVQKDTKRHSNGDAMFRMPVVSLKAQEPLTRTLTFKMAPLSVACLLWSSLFLPLVLARFLVFLKLKLQLYFGL